MMAMVDVDAVQYDELGTQNYQREQIDELK
jgi:hypothetical protein